MKGYDYISSSHVILIVSTGSMLLLNVEEKYPESPTQGFHLCKMFYRRNCNR